MTNTIYELKDLINQKKKNLEDSISDAVKEILVKFGKDEGVAPNNLIIDISPVMCLGEAKPIDIFLSTKVYL